MESNKNSTLEKLSSTNTFNNDETNSQLQFINIAENISKDIEVYTENLNNNALENSKVTDIKEEDLDTNTSNNYKASFIMEATAYTGDTITATGTTPVRDPNGISTIAVDPSIIPLGSKVYIHGYGEAIAADTGGAIKGHIIDLFLNSENECKNWGRQNVTVNIIAYPGEW